ncbi:DUF5302 domain-containing protein [Tessaracoccus sp.]
MTEPESTDAPLDPKEAMRLALERKKQNEHLSAANGINSDKNQGGRAQSQMGGKRQFRRKSGG